MTESSLRTLCAFGDRPLGANGRPGRMAYQPRRQLSSIPVRRISTSIPLYAYAYIGRVIHSLPKTDKLEPARCDNPTEIEPNSVQ